MLFHSIKPVQYHKRLKLLYFCVCVCMYTFLYVIVVSGILLCVVR